MMTLSDADEVAETHQQGVVLRSDQAACAKIPEPCAHQAVMHDDPARSPSDFIRQKLRQAYPRAND